MAWKTIGSAQKSKVFTVSSGEQFRLRDLTSNVTWRNPIVYAQVGNIFFDQQGASMGGTSAGFRALTQHISDDLYTVFVQSLEFTPQGQTDIEAIRRGVQDNNWGSIRSIGATETQHIGYYPNFRGCEFFYYIEPTDYSVLVQPDPRNSSTWYTENIQGRLEVLVENEVIFSVNVQKGMSVHSFAPSYVRSGNVFVRNNLSKYILHGQVKGRARYVINPYTAQWVTKNGSATVFVMESEGASY